MTKKLPKEILDHVQHDLLQFGFTEREDDVTENLCGIVMKKWNFFRRITGGHGMVAVVEVPPSITKKTIKPFFQNVRKEINTRCVGFGAYKSSHSFIVLVCSNKVFASIFEFAPQLKDRTGLHVNIIQGVIMVDSDTKKVSSDYTKPAQNKNEYDAVLSAIDNAIQNYIIA